MITTILVGLGILALVVVPSLGFVSVLLIKQALLGLKLTLVGAGLTAQTANTVSAMIVLSGIVLALAVIAYLTPARKPVVAEA